MSKKRRKKRPAAKPARTSEPRTSEPRTSDSRTSEPRTSEPRTSDSRTPDEPAFWFGFEIAWAKLAVTRVVLFGMLTIDALMQIRHAPRYGAGGFNVGQLPLLDGLGPTRTLYGLAELINAYLFVLAACGVGTRIAIPLATVIYSWLYFGSQLDSYQHHYLIALVLLLACVVPWRRPATADTRTPVRAWGLRLVLVQLAIMYLWAAISKMNATWIDGRTLAGQIGGIVRTVVDGTVGTAGASCIVIVVELALAATIWNRRTWWIAAPLGIAFHVGILFSKLEIGLFAWLMLAIYVLVIPDRIWIWLAETRPSRAVLGAARVAAKYFDGAHGWLLWVAAVALGLVLAATSRFEHALAIGIALALVPVAAAVAQTWWPRRAHLAWLASAHLLAFATWTAVDRASTLATDYYRFWGGNARRLGDREGAEEAYRKLLAVDAADPSGHYQLGRILLARGDDDEALAHLHEAQRLEPSRARAYLVEARWLAGRGRRDEAIAKAREARRADPGDADARSLLEALTGQATKQGVEPAREDDRDTR